MSILQDFGNALSKGFGKFLETYDKVAKPIGRSISTGILLTDTDNPEFNDGFQLSDIKRTYKRAEKISPGQAFVGASDLPVQGLARAIARPFGDKAPTFLQKDFDIYNEEQRKKAFNDEIVGKIASGSIDAVVTWFADPLVLGGKAIKVARAGGKIRGKEFSGILEMRAPKTSEDVSKAVASGGWDEFLNQAIKTDGAGLLKNRTVQKSSNPELMASVFGDITDKETAVSALKAVLGDQQALADLTKVSNKANKDLVTIIKRQKKEIEKLSPGTDYNNFLKTPEGQLFKDEVEALKIKDTYFANALDLAQQNVYATGTTVSRFRFTEARRAAAGRSKMETTLGRGIWRFQDFQHSPFNAVMRVVTWGGRQRPSGWVTARGINAAGSGDEIIAFMDNVQPWSGVEGAKLKQKYLNQYLRAGDAERSIVVEKIEKDAINAVAKQFGFDEVLDGVKKQQIAREFGIPESQINTIGDAIYAKTLSRRGNIMDSVKKEGYFLDEEKRRVFLPFISSQLPEAIPMVDIRLFQTLAKEHTSGLRAAAATITDKVESAYSVFDSLWRPSVLMRLGYPQRNVGEGSLRAMAYMNGFMEYMRPFEGLNNFQRNRIASFKDRYSRYQAKSILETQRGKNISFLPTWKQVSDLQNHELRLLRADKELRLTSRKEIADKLKKTRNKDARARLKSELDQIDNRLILLDDAIKTGEDNVKFIIDRSSRKGIKGNRHRIGQKAYIHNGIKIKGAFEDDIGNYALRMSSAERKTSLELANPMSIHEDIANKSIITQGWSSVKPYVDNVVSDDYIKVVGDAARVFKNDEVTKRLMLAVDPELAIDDIVKAAKTDKKLQKDLADSGVRLNSKSIREHVNSLAPAIKAYFPDEALRRELATSDKVSPLKIREALKDRKDLVPISGETIRPDTQKSLYKSYRQTVNKIFKYIGALPEDTLVRHPFYNAVYKRTVNAQVDRALADGREITNEIMERFVANAHRNAMKETNRTLYTIQRYSNAAAVFAFFSPFIQAQLNTMRVWGRLTYENPQIVGRAFQIWGATEAAGLEEKDPITGDTYVTFQAAGVLPDWLEKATGGQTVMRFPKRGANLVLAGEPWWNPGAGPVVQIAASELLKNSPDIDQQLTEKIGFPIPSKEVLDFIVQRGPSDKPLSWDLILPASAKRLVSGLRGTADEDYARNLTSIYAIEMQRFKDGTRETEPTFDEVRQKNDAFFMLRLFTNLTLPVVPQYRSEYEFYIQKWRTEQQKGTVGGLSAEERFYRDYPEYFTLAISTTKNVTGIDPTVNAVNRAKKHRNLVTRLGELDPYLIQLVTNEDVERNFDQAAYTWQMETSPIPGDKGKFRERISPMEAVKRQDVKAGWIEYVKFMDALDAELEKNNIKSLNSKAGRQYKEVKDRFIQDLQAQNKAFAEEYGIYEIGGWKKTIIAINEILENEKFMEENDSEPWALMRDYMDSREDMISLLEQRAAMGGSANITAKSNVDLQEAWDAYISDIKAENTLFSSWYNRFLDNDTLEKI